MSDNNVIPGGVKIDKLILTGPNRSSIIDINEIATEINIYESLDQPFVSMDILIEDALALSTIIPIIGNEKIEIDFHVPVPGMQNDRYTKTFRVFAIKDTEITKSVRKVVYILRCYDEAYFKDLTQKVQKSYTNMKVSEMVKKICKDYLEIQCEVEDTNEDLTIVVPNMKPTYAIRELLKRYSRSSVYSKFSDYFLWSTKNGTYYKTLQSLMDISQRKNDIQIDEYNLREKNYFGAEIDTNNQDQIEDIEENTKPAEWLRLNAFEIKNKMNIEKAIKYGMFDSNLWYINPSLSIYEKNEYNYLKEFNQDVKKLDSNFGYPVIQTEKTDFHDLNGKSIEYFIVTNKSNPNETDDKRYEFLHRSYASEKMLEYIDVNFTIPGDNTRTVGDIIKVKLPEFSGTDDKIGEIDKFISGEYLVTAVRHIIRINGAGYTVHMNCMKNCFNTSVDDAISENFEKNSDILNKQKNNFIRREL